MNDNPITVLVDRDRLANANRADTARVCVRLFSAVQHLPPQHQVLGLACSFLLMADAAGIAAQDAFTFAKNLMADDLHSDRLAPQFAAMRFHAKGGLR